MKRQLAAAALALLCSVATGTAKEDHHQRIDKAIADLVISRLGTKPRGSECPSIVHTERVGTKQSLIATCSNNESYLIIEDPPDLISATSCTWMRKQEGILTSPCHPPGWRALPTIIRGAN